MRIASFLLFTMTATFVGSSGSTNTDPVPAGYAWSANIGKPSPLLKTKTGINRQLAAGVYDVATVPFGDNWTCPVVGAYATVTLAKAGCISVMPRFPVAEPSAGFLILLRGPYSAGAAESARGYWQINTLPGGMRRGRTSMPVYSHTGGRYDRYLRNGYRWEGDGYFPMPDLTGNTPAIGPRRIANTTKVPVTACATAPDVTVLCSLPATQIWMAHATVDMLGRETPISDPILIDLTANAGVGSYAIARRQGPVEHGACGFRIYAGFAPDDLHRQPVLDYQGSADKWLWPLWCQAFPLHDVRTDTPAPSPSATVSSLLSPPQQDVVVGLNTINQPQRNYDLYCPFILHYDSNNNNREFTGKATYTHRNTWDGQPLETDIPMLLLQNFGDRPKCMKFVSNYAIAGVASNDWAGGGAMSNVLERCVFHLFGKETYGFLVDENSSLMAGSHTASEITFRECEFSANVPVKLEGNQTGKIRFADNCEFAGQSSNTRYPADTVGIIYAANPGTTVFDFVKGVNGTFRSLISVCAYQDQASVIVRNLFVDQGCPVVVSFSGYAGGTVSILDGEKINAPSVGWCRLVEAPVALSSQLRMGDVGMTPYLSSVSFMLNQLSIINNAPAGFGDVIAPTEASWLAKGLQFEYANPGNPAYYDFTKKRPLLGTVGVAGFPDAVPVNPGIVY